MKVNALKIYTGICALASSALACRPVITVGWQEVGILVVIMLVLLGPPLFNFYKRFDEFRNWKSGKDEPKE